MLPLPSPLRGGEGVSAAAPLPGGAAMYVYSQSCSDVPAWAGCFSSGAVDPVVLPAKERVVVDFQEQTRKPDGYQEAGNGNDNARIQEA